MNTYDVTINYQTKFGVYIKNLIIQVEAKNESEARRLATTRFKKDRRRLGSQVVGLTSTLVMAEPPTEFAMGQTYTDRWGGNFRVLAEFTDKGRRMYGVVKGSQRPIVMTHSELLDKVMPKIVIEHWTVYPNGNVYKNDPPVCNSQYPLEDLVRIKVTKVNGKITEKEFL